MALNSLWISQFQFCACCGYCHFKSRVSTSKSLSHQRLFFFCFLLARKAILSSFLFLLCSYWVGTPYIWQSSSSRITLFSKQVYPSERIGIHCCERIGTWFLTKFPGGLNFKVVSKCKAKGSIRSFYASYSWSGIIHLNRRVQIFYLRKVLTSFISKKRNPSSRVLQGKKFLYKESDG